MDLKENPAYAGRGRGIRIWKLSILAIKYFR